MHRECTEKKGEETPEVEIVANIEKVNTEETPLDSVYFGIDLDELKFKTIVFHSELKNTWCKWSQQGLPEENKKRNSGIIQPER